MHQGVVQSSQFVSSVSSKFLYKPFLGSSNNVQLVVLALGVHAWRAVLLQACSLHAGQGLEYMYDDHVASCPLT